MCTLWKLSREFGRDLSTRPVYWRIKKMLTKTTNLTDVNRKAKTKHFCIAAICVLYIFLSGIFATITLDEDEFGFIREPYEIIGGDYTLGYLKRHEYYNATVTLVKSFYFYWNYRPLNAPVIPAGGLSIFKIEEEKFGYSKPSSVPLHDPASIEKFGSRLVVPEPDRFYRHGAGKPLLPALLSIPQLAAIKLLGINNQKLLNAQFSNRPDPIFISLRLVQIFGGLASILIVFAILQRTVDIERALLGALIFAIFPMTIKYFPNLHHDSILVPFFLLSVYLYIKRKYLAAGVAYGLALASKNLAVILLPALIADIAIQAFRLWHQGDIESAFTFLRHRLSALALMGVVALATLLPFANPVSYFEEVLTPIISRPIDPRGENVNKWSLKNVVDKESKLSPQVTFVQKFLYFKDVGFFFLVITICLALQRPLSDTARISILLILIYLPIGPIFGLDFGYRTLLLVPFFAMLAAELLEPKQLRWLAGGIGILALVYVSNPSRTDLLHEQYIAK